MSLYTGGGRGIRKMPKFHVYNERKIICDSQYDFRLFENQKDRL